MSRTLLHLVLTAAIGGASFAGCVPSPADERHPALDAPAVRRGNLEDRILMTGELRAVQSRPLVVPRTPEWVATTQWLAADGTRVKAGDPVAQLDNSTLVAKLEDQKLALTEAEQELQKTLAEVGAERERKGLEVFKARVERDKARLDAEVPESLLARREYQEKQLALEKAEAALEKATREKGSCEKSAAFKIRLCAVKRDEARRRLTRAESTMESMTLRAPADGLFVVGLDIQFGRKLEQGDSVRAGQTLAEIPDLDRMEVEAYLSDVDDGQVVPGLPARCRLDAYPSRIFPGEVLWVGPVAQGKPGFSSRRFFRVRVSLQEVDPDVMRPGMSVEVEVIRRRWTNAFLVPFASLDFRQGDPALILSDGRAMKVAVAGCGSVECALTGAPPVGTSLGHVP
jgi:multidrug efflux pump subunit AcrA (membrane-fusion protein)